MFYEYFDDLCLFIGLSFLKCYGFYDFLLEKLKDEKVFYILMGMVFYDVEGFFNFCIDVFSDFEGKVVIVVGDWVDFKKIKKVSEYFFILFYVF